MLKRIIAGEGRSEDLGLLHRCGESYRGAHDLCAGRHCLWRAPVQSFLKHFRLRICAVHEVEHNGRSIMEGATHLDGRPKPFAA